MNTVPEKISGTSECRAGYLPSSQEYNPKINKTIANETKSGNERDLVLWQISSTGQVNQYTDEEGLIFR
jgi:hypothetical protein